MVWQPRVTVGDDLARLHESSRAADMSRDLGYSSISMGEGSLDLIVGDDAENTRVVLGDQSDGRFGIGLWHRGGMKYLPDVLEDAEDRITGTENKNTQQDGRLDGHDDDVDRIDAKNGEQDGRLTGAEGRLGSAEGRLDGVEGRMGEAEGRLDGHATRLGAVEGRNATQDNRLGNHDSALSSQSSRITDAQSDADAAMAQADTAKNRADDAWTLANGKPSRDYVDNLNENLNDKLDARVAQLMTAIRLVASRSEQPDPFL
ncbi:hypothetical protein C1N80_06145 [Brachybacterium sp. SGAir0954]|uniref:hypothetical protein n=1 Tax=Brachybacterium sp. SGAir0954 TaxID=2571029 RepID=UPI0010CD1E0C|nr:hypothetical protein [Brachybacterium sp. SGAir0954]QCR53201.1 hypothetical protein C1N80_06145 [Brachybacterium sp. SGAir0954]